MFSSYFILSVFREKKLPGFLSCVHLTCAVYCPLTAITQCCLHLVSVDSHFKLGSVLFIRKEEWEMPLMYLLNEKCVFQDM